MKGKKAMNILMYLGIGLLVLGVISIVSSLLVSRTIAQNTPETTTILETTTTPTTVAETTTSTTTTTEEENTTKKAEDSVLNIDNFKLIAKANKLTDLSEEQDPGYDKAKAYACAVGRKNSNGKYASAFEYYEFEDKNEAKTIAIRYCTADVGDIENIKERIILAEKDICEAEAYNDQFYFRSYCDGKRVLLLSCQTKQKDDCLKIFNTMK